MVEEADHFLGKDTKPGAEARRGLVSSMMFGGQAAKCKNSLHCSVEGF